MLRPTSVCAIIPARGASKGIPRKNMVILAGKPLLVHSIGHAKGSKLIGRVIGATEAEKSVTGAMQN